MTDYNEIYIEMFDMLKNHRYDKFLKTLNEIDTTDIMFDINTRDEQNNYFLTYAVTLNEPTIVSNLIEKGAKIDITDKYDRSILTTAITYSYHEVLHVLLEANKNNIGISILDIKDRLFRIPLHYAIEIQNVKAVKMLLEYGSNTNSSDKDGLNSLHIAVKSRSLEICEMVVKYIGDINFRYNTGENALHMACNLQLIEIARLLIKNGINVNAQDYSHEITALHYSVLLNNKELVGLLLKDHADPNIQDIYGNTSVHYCIVENNFEVFMMLTQSIDTKNIINLNLWNIDGEIPLHLVLKKDDDSMADCLNLMIDKSNLSLQDINGNTCLHYLIKLDLWKDYVEILKKKRLDVFVININKKMPIDLIKEKDKDLFVELLVDSYLYRLVNANLLWYDEWENICSKNFDILTHEEKNVMKNIEHGGKVQSSASLEKTCRNIIKQKIIKLIKKIKDGEELQCTEKSFPMRKSIVCVKMSEGSLHTNCTFTGTTLDILIGVIFLLKKHKTACASLTKNFNQNKELCGFYKSIGIIMNSRCEFLNFEIVWVHQKLYLMEGFYDNFRKCLQNKKRFIIIPIGIEMREGSHAGYLLYDNLTQEMERFEPHGSTAPPGLFYNPDLLDEILEAKMKIIDDQIKYIRPMDYLPKVGFQMMDVSEQ